jgi:hypothetical protein
MDGFAKSGDVADFAQRRLARGIGIEAGADVTVGFVGEVRFEFGFEIGIALRSPEVLLPAHD